MAAAVTDSEAEGAQQPPLALTVEAIYEAHFDFVWRSLRRMGVPQHRMDDAAQDVFVVVHRRLGEFAQRSSVKTWLFGIVLRVARDHRRTQKRKEQPITNPDPDGLPDVTLDDPLRRAELADSVRIFRQLVIAMSQDKREIFVLSELEGMTAPEVSDALGIAVSTVQSRLRAARSEFEAALSRLRAQQGGGSHGHE